MSKRKRQKPPDADTATVAAPAVQMVADRCTKSLADRFREVLRLSDRVPDTVVFSEALERLRQVIEAGHLRLRQNARAE